MTEIKWMTDTGTGDAVLHWLLDNVPMSGWAAEFGTHSGRTTKRIAATMPVISFDSFEGLPEDWREGFPKGEFAKNMLNAMPDWTPNVMLVKGWFEDTVPGFVFPPLGLVHIDCDLYSSAVTALAGVVDAIGEGTIVLFDEFQGYPGAEDHEEKAWEEFCNEHHVVAETIAVGDQSRAFRIVHIGGSW